MTSLLIVEDEQIVALDLQICLVKQGYQVLATAANARDALILTHDLQPDLVLMDVKISGPMDGIEAGKLIGEMGIPVIYLTAFSDTATVKRAAESMPYGFLGKPFQTPQVAAGIEVAIYRSRLERQLREDKELLITEQDQLLTLLTHEIRTPLSTIGAATESLRILDPDANQPDRRRRYERITEAMRQADKMLNIATRRDYLEHINQAPESIDLVALTREVMGGQPDELNARIVLEVTIGCLPVKGYPMLVRVILNALLDNALKYSPDSSPVTIEIGESAIHRTIHWTIQDQGPGIPGAIQEKIFEKFFRADSATSIPGLGMGLAVSRQVADRMGGSVTLQDSPTGARFAVTLPAYRS